MSNSPVQETRGAYADTDAFVGLVFAISGKFSEPHTALSALIKRHAGDVKASVTKAVTHLVSTVDDFGARSHKVDKALANGIPIVTERWVRESIEANEALPLRPEYVLHAGNQPLAESEEATAVKSSPRTASVDEGAKGEQGQENEAGDARELQEQSAEEAGPPPTAPSISIDESKLPSAILTQAKDASLPVLHATIGDMHPAAPSPPPAPSLSAATSTIVPPPVAELPTAVQPPRPTEQQTAAPAAPVDAPLSPVSVAEGAESMVDVNAPAAPSALTPTEETLLIEHTAAARIPPLPSPSREALQEAAAAEGDTMVTDDAVAGREAHVGEKRKVEEPPAPIVEPEAPPTKRRKLENEEQQAEVAGAAPSQNGGQPEGESAQPAPTTEALERAPPAESNAGSSAVLPPSQALSLPVAPPPAMDVTPSGAETGGPTAMDVTQRAYHLKVLQRKEYSAGTAHELAGLVEKQLLEGINVHNDSTVGLGSLADVFARGVDGGAVLIENVRDYTGEDYYNIITYARQGREFGSLHRNDEILAVGLVRDGTFSAVRAEDQPLMERLLHIHQPIVPISAASPATS